MMQQQCSMQEKLNEHTKKRKYEEKIEVEK